jgi:AraC-like DNA-binding protein
MLQRAPRPELAPFISRLWACEPGAATEPGARERVLPTGAMHLVIRFDEPLRIFAEVDAPSPTTIGHAVIGGARAAAYVRDTSRPASSVGAQLRPGTAELLLGVPADVLAERHTVLDDVWGAAASELRDRLASTAGAARRLDLFEAQLLARLPRLRGVHPAVAHALAQLTTGADVAGVVDEVGYSHRRFITLFHHAVGLTPKRFCRVQRLQRALAGITTLPLAAVAADAGFSDQAHLTREFRELAGVSPGAYRALVSTPSNHVPIKPR